MSRWRKWFEHMRLLNSFKRPIWSFINKRTTWWPISKWPFNRASSLCWFGTRWRIWRMITCLPVLLINHPPKTDCQWWPIYEDLWVLFKLQSLFCIWFSWSKVWHIKKKTWESWQTLLSMMMERKITGECKSSTN